MSEKTKKILIGVAILVAVLAGSYFLFVGNPFKRKGGATENGDTDTGGGGGIFRGITYESCCGDECFPIKKGKKDAKGCTVIQNLQKAMNEYVDIFSGKFSKSEKVEPDGVFGPKSLRLYKKVAKRYEVKYTDNITKTAYNHVVQPKYRLS